MNEQVDAERTQNHTRLRAQVVNQILRWTRTLKALCNAPRMKLIRWNMVEIQCDQAYLSYKPHPSNHVRSRIPPVNRTLWQVGTLKTHSNAPRMKSIGWKLVEIQRNHAHLSSKPYQSKLHAIQDVIGQSDIVMRKNTKKAFQRTQNKVNPI